MKPFQPHPNTADSWVTQDKDNAIEYLIRRTCGTYYVYNYTRYVGAAIRYPDAEKLAKKDNATTRRRYGIKA